jgi:hypothetical protein
MVASIAHLPSFANRFEQESVRAQSPQPQWFSGPTWLGEGAAVPASAATRKRVAQPCPRRARVFGAGGVGRSSLERDASVLVGARGCRDILAPHAADHLVECEVHDPIPSGASADGMIPA